MSEISEMDTVVPETYTKMSRNLSEKLRSKWPPTTCGYSMVKIACLDDAFSEYFLNWKQSQKKVNHSSKKIRKGEKGKAKNQNKPKA